MVRKLSQTDSAEVAKAVSEAERRTAAEIVVVVAPVSDPYQSYILLFGLIAGSLLAFALWAAKILKVFPFLLAVQLASMAVVSFLPGLRAHLLCLVPEKILRRRGAHRAYEEYLSASQHIPSSTPLALLYVSLAERYAHIQTSRHVREKIGDSKWNEIVNDFTTAVGKDGLKDSIINSVRKMADLLSIPFPDRAEPDAAPGLIEVKD